ncbi:MAG: 50S ribosomal protein L22 [Thermoproteales archaeon]|nr:50S ribosomal protein L22 [Thermoproteales archaeon]RLE66339.1 MAG: 50S ribosomal protein L22 [Thermoprotei archaeon]
MGGRWGYSVQDLDPIRTAIASGRDLRISWKHAVEVCDAIRGLKLEEAERLLTDVIEMKRPIPFKRFNKKVAHRRQLSGWPSGRWPVKAAKEILKVLKNAEANAEYKGLDIDRLWVVHAAAHKSIKIRKYIPRAFGRATPYFQQLVHVEIALEER